MLIKLKKVQKERIVKKGSKGENNAINNNSNTNNNTTNTTSTSNNHELKLNLSSDKTLSDIAEEDKKENDEEIKNSKNEDDNKDSNEENSFDSLPDEKDNEIENEKEEEITLRTIDKKKTRKGIMRIGSMDVSTTLEKTKKYTVNANNLEIFKMQERLDEILAPL